LFVLPKLNPVHLNENKSAPLYFGLKLLSIDA
jgi:hypothetical protein